MKPLDRKTWRAIAALAAKADGARTSAMEAGSSYLGEFPIAASSGEVVGAFVYLMKKGRPNQTAETDLVKNRIEIYLSAFSSAKDLKERLPRLLEHEASHVRDHLDSPARRFESPVFLRAGRKIREAIQSGRVKLKTRREDLSVGARSETYARDVVDDGLVQGLLQDAGVFGEEAQLAVIATALRNLPGKDVRKDYANSSDEIRAFVAEAASELRPQFASRSPSNPAHSAHRCTCAPTGRQGRCDRCRWCERCRRCERCGAVQEGAHGAFGSVRAAILASQTWKHVKPRMSAKNRERFVREVSNIIANDLERTNPTASRLRHDVRQRAGRAAAGQNRLS